MERPSCDDIKIKKGNRKEFKIIQKKPQGHIKRNLKQIPITKLLQ